MKKDEHISHVSAATVVDGKLDSRVVPEAVTLFDFAYATDNVQSPKMIRNSVVCLVVVMCTLLTTFDCKTVVGNTADIATQKNLRNPSTTTANNRISETRQDSVVTNRILKTRQVPTALLEIPVTSPPLRVYQGSTLKTYPFTLVNTNYPTYFSYAYPGNLGYTFFQ
ncbi:Hypothetical protein CINCED_3A020512 [Cinara cedri]|uniref:Uncharacterized protein n=1 Tax=Cinara cedri TaxID=506608 RepID=A0A5E4M6C2_9HEMI|nr:Hypothetical protein CINCED_3A020512 [Cinara cedri]